MLDRLKFLIVLLGLNPYGFAIFNGLAPGANLSNLQGGTIVAPNIAQAIRIITPDDHFCNAVCISKTAALTAGHCPSNETDGGVQIYGTNHKSKAVIMKPGFLANVAPDNTIKENLVRYDLAVLIFSTGCTDGIRVASQPLYSSSPILMTAWGVRSLTDKDKLKAGDVKKWVGVNSILRRNDGNRVYRIEGNPALVTTDGTNALTRPGNSGSGLFDLSTLELIGIDSSHYQDPARNVRNTDYVSLLSPESVALIEEAKKKFPADIPDSLVAAVKQKSAPTITGGPALTVPSTPVVNPTSPTPVPSPAMATAAAPTTKKPVRRLDPPNFLRIEAAMKAEIEKAFAVRIEEGLYYTNQRKAATRADLNGTLIAEESIPDPSNKEEMLRIGYAPDQPHELWLLDSHHLKHLLVRSIGEPNTFMPIPNYYIELPNGVAYFNEQWLLFKKPFDGKPEVPYKLRAHSIKSHHSGKQSPILFYNKDLNKLFLVHWSFLPSADSDPNTPPPSSVEVSLIDFYNDETIPLREELDWPFGFQANGIFFLGANPKNAIHFQELNWREGKLGRARKLPFRFDSSYEIKFAEGELLLSRRNRLGSSTALWLDSSGRQSVRKSPENRFTAVSDPLDRAISNLAVTPPPENLIAQETLAAIYSLPTLNDQLATALGASRNTWTILVYKKGQNVEELVKGFFQASQNGSTSVPATLQKLDRVWMLPADSTFDPKSEDETTDRMNTLRDATEGKRSVLVLHNFPTTILESVNTSMTQFFWTHFGRCTRDGKCRVLMTIPENIFAKLYQDSRSILNNAQIVHVPEMDEQTRTDVADMLRRKLEGEYGKRMSAPAFTQVLRFAKQNQGLLSSPGTEEAALRQVFDFIETTAPQTQEISSVQIKSFISRGLTQTARQLGNFKSDELCKYLKRETVGNHDTIDKICDLLKPLENGTHLGPTPITYFALAGTPGIGKTHIARHIANYLTGPDSELLIDFNNFEGWDSEKAKKTFEAIRSAPDQLKVVVFDDVDRGTFDDLDRIRGIFDNGYWAKGTANEVAFKNTIVIITSNWGEKLVLNNSKFENDIYEKLSREIVVDETDKTHGEANPRGKISNRVWRVLQGRIFALRPFDAPQLLALGLKLCKDEDAKLLKTKEVHLKVHPLILSRYANPEKAARSGASYVINALAGDVFPAYQRALGNSDHAILLVPVGNRVEAVTDRDPNYEFWSMGIDHHLAAIRKEGPGWYLEENHTTQLQNEWKALWRETLQRKRGKP